MHDISQSPPRTWAEIDYSALLHNLEVARKSSGCQVMAVLKAEAYGHDLKRISAFLDPHDLAFFGVASVFEARKLAKIDIKTRVYLLGPTFAKERQEIVQMRWTPSISNLEEASHFDSLNTAHSPDSPLLVHLTVDTGMGRGGFLPDQLSNVFPELLKLKHISIEGIGSHLPSADEDREFTLIQYENFHQAVVNCQFDFKFIHLANSAGLLDYSSTVVNLCRPGLMLYGLSPIPKFQSQLKPVMTLKSRISIIRELPKGHGISYGRSTILERDSRIATVGIGYGDGYPRSASSNKPEVFLHGKRCRIIGRITMDQIMIDVTDLPEARSGDELELFGSNILATEVAEKSDTISEEILTRITPRVTKIFLDSTENNKIYKNPTCESMRKTVVPKAKV